MMNLDQRIYQAEQRRQQAIDEENRRRQAEQQRQTAAVEAERELAQLYAAKRSEAFENTLAAYQVIVDENARAVQALMNALAAHDYLKAERAYADVLRTAESAVQSIHGALAIVGPDIDAAATAARQRQAEPTNAIADHEAYIAATTEISRRLQRFTMPIPPYCVCIDMVSKHTGDERRIMAGLCFALTGNMFNITSGYNMQADADTIIRRQFIR